MKALFFSCHPLTVEGRRFFRRNTDSVLQTQIFPVIRRNVLERYGLHSGEGIVKDDVILSGDASSLKVQDERHLGRVQRTEAKEDATPGTWLPTRELLAGLKLRIQDVYWTTPDAKIFEAMTRNGTTSEEISWTEPVVTRSGIVDEGGVVDSHGPEGAVDAILPVNGGVKNHGAGHVRDGADSAFSCAVLMMGICPTESQSLVMVIDMRDKGIGFESSPIGKILLNEDTIVHAELFEVLLCSNRFDCRKSELHLHMDVFGGGVDKNTPTLVLGRGRATKGVVCAPQQARLKVVDGDAGSGVEVVCCKGSLSSRRCGTCRRPKGATMIVCIMANLTLKSREITGRSGLELGPEKRREMKDALDGLEAEVAEAGVP